MSLDGDNEEENKKISSFQKFINSCKPSADNSLMANESSNQIIAQNSKTEREPAVKSLQYQTTILNEPKCVPVIDTFSRIISEKQRRDREGETLWDGLYKMHETKSNKLQTKIVEKIEEEDKKIQLECPFKPSIIPNKVKIEQTGKVYERSMNWKQSAIDKIEKRKEKQTENELKGCNFSPEINGSTNKSKEVKVVNNSVQKHLERQKNAELEQDFKKERLEKYSGKNWCHRVTMPDEYKLSASPKKFVFELIRLIQVKDLLRKRSQSM